MSIVSGDLVNTEHSRVVEARNVTGTQNWLLNISTVAPDKDVETTEHILAITEHISLQNTVQQIILHSTTEIAQNLQDITTRTFSFVNNSQPEVTIRKPEELSDSDTIGTAEKVVIGAAVIVACLTLTAIILRILGPYFRSKRTNKEKDEEKIFTADVLISKLSLTNLGTDSASQSSGTGNTSSQDCSQSTGSNPVTDWSELSRSTDSRSSSDDLEVNMAGKHYSKMVKPHQMHGRYSTNSLPTVYMSEDRLSSKGSPGLHRKHTDEQMSIISTQSLEPLRLEQQYRDRWDDQFDPCGSLPRGNLSHHSHPSESRLSLNSMSSGGSYPPVHPTFPIPSKEFVRQIHMDKDRRYPSNAPTVKKEKHVRLSPPNR